VTTVAASKVDVLIPAFNAASTVREAVDSILAQTLRDIRVVVVDDGSTDATPAILSSLAREDERIHVVTTPNQGIVEARNEALRHATADFIACLDSDDLALPQRLERQLEYLAAHPECVAVGTRIEHMDESGAPLHGMIQPGAPSEADAAKVPAAEPYIVQSTLMARRAPIEAIGCYRHVPNSEDSDLFWRLAERGTLVILPETLGRYRVHSASTSSSIVSGRVMAVGSQLGALSSLRRKAGRPDLAFPRRLHEEMIAAATLEGMCVAAAGGLDPEEAQRLRVAAGAKLMQMARYRPYEPDVGDCAFIRAALPFAARLGEENRKVVDWYVTVTAARLIRKGMLREAFALTPPRSYPVAAARVLLSR
jgi:glycosyltransferase involved in cell wall biosynthesis